MNLNENFFDAIRLFVASVMLIYSSYLDLKERVVPNRVWLAFGTISIGILLSQIFLSQIQLREMVMLSLNIIIMVALSIGGFYIGLYGGADAKAFMVLSVLQPLWPYYTLRPLPQIPFMLDVLVNGALISLANVVFFLLLNAYRGNLKMPYSLFGFKAKLEKVRGKFFWPMYKMEGDKLILTIKPPMDEEEEEKIWEEIERRGMEEIWVTPQLPFLVYVTIGYFITAIYGDLILNFFLRLIPA